METYYNPGDIINQYSIIKIIGEGRYGIVYLAQDYALNKYVLKQLKSDMIEITRKKLFYEEDILKKLNDVRFPKFVENLNYEDNQIYVLEYLDGKDFEVLLSDEEYKFNRDEIYDIAEQLIDIVDTLQNKGIIHRDLRTPNLLLDPEHKLKLIDFGLSRYIDENKYVKEIDYWYMGDFLIHLYYTSYYKESGLEERPWFEELNISNEECLFLKKLMGIDNSFRSIDEIKSCFQLIKNKYK